MRCGQTPDAFELMVEHLAIPPIPPPTQTILAIPVRNEHDARPDRRRGVDRMDLVDSLVTRCSAIQEWIIGRGWAGALLEKDRRQILNATMPNGTLLWIVFWGPGVF